MSIPSSLAAPSIISALTVESEGIQVEMLTSLVILLISEVQMSLDRQPIKDESVESRTVLTVLTKGIETAMPRDYI